MGFHDYKTEGKCDVCGKVGEIVVCCSSMGAVSFAYCEDCFNNFLEPYEHMVSYIACAGHFPQDINETYQKLCRDILKKMNISEEKFIEDVEAAIKEIYDYFNTLQEEGYQNNNIKFSDLKLEDEE